MQSKRHVYSHRLTRAGIVLSALGLWPSAFGRTRDTDQATGPPDFDLSRHTIGGGAVIDP